MQNLSFSDVLMVSGGADKHSFVDDANVTCSTLIIMNMAASVTGWVIKHSTANALAVQAGALTATGTMMSFAPVAVATGMMLNKHPEYVTNVRDKVNYYFGV